MTGNQRVQNQAPAGDNSRAPMQSTSDSKRHSSRSGYGRTARKVLRLKITVVALSLALVVASFGWIVTNAKLSGVTDRFYQYQLNSRQEISEREDHTAEIERLKAEKEILVKGIIPGLRLLEFDSTITMDDEYFRNIGFTLTGTNYAKNYEYRIVLHNGTLNVVTPTVTVFLFDDRGIQVGLTELSRIDATSKVEFNNLQPNETRSYTGRIGLNIPSEPKYFLVDVK